jgi:prepilin signal peptidase PulO-like enzyme (type II secretory pathway)
MIELPNFVIVILGCLLSLAWGSFMGAAFYRIPLRFSGENILVLSLWKGRSECPHCHHLLSVFDLVPIFSWILLKGKCRYCHQKIGSSYFLIESFALLVFLFSFYVLNLEYIAIFVSLIATTLLIMSLIDLKHYILPDELQLLLLILFAALCFLTAAPVDVLLNGLWGLLVGAGILFLVRLVYFYWRGLEGIGLGDIKLVGIAGLYIGVQGIPFMLLIGSLSTLCIAIPYMLIQKKKDMKLMLPFGPGLALGFLVTFILQHANVLPL